MLGHVLFDLEIHITRNRSLYFTEVAIVHLLGGRPFVASVVRKQSTSAVAHINFCINISLIYVIVFGKAHSEKPIQYLRTPLSRTQFSRLRSLSWKPRNREQTYKVSPGKHIICHLASTTLMPTWECDAYLVSRHFSHDTAKLPCHPSQAFFDYYVCMLLEGCLFEVALYVIRHNQI